MKEQIINGLQLLSPNIFVPWSINTAELKELFNNYDIKYVTPQYYTIPALLPADIDCMLGLHFDYGLLNWFELFRNQNYYETHDLITSYNDFQAKFEIIWGKPHQSNKSMIDGFENHFWHFKKITITHSVYERFCICEGVSMRRK